MSYKIYKRKGTPAYQLCIMLGNKRHRCSLKTHNRTIAEKIAKKLHNTMVKEYFGIKGDITLDGTMDRFLTYSKKSKKSYQTDVGRSKNILEFFTPMIPLKDIKKSMVLDFIAHLKKDKGHAQNTVNHHLALFKAAINLVRADKDYTGDNVISSIKLKKVKSKSEMFSVSEIRNILNYAYKISQTARSKSQAYFYPFIFIAVYSGMRAGEIFNLRWPDVKPSSIILRKPKSQQDFEKIPNLPWLNDLIQSLPKESFYIINTNQRTTNTFRRIWLKMRTDLSLNQGATIHWLRHSFASYLASEGVPLNIIQALLRHSSISTTQIYLHQDFDQMKNAMMNMEKIFSTNLPHLKAGI